MRLTPYRRVLALPGVRSLMLYAFLARIPVTAVGMALTFHVLVDLDGGYAKAGLVGTAATIATALGAPFTGRLTDRRGLRVTVTLGTVIAVAFWASAPRSCRTRPWCAPRSSVAWLECRCSPPHDRRSPRGAPPDQRRSAFTLDAMSTEFSYMVGPALAVVLATQVSPRVSMVVIGVGVVLAGVGLYMPSTRPPNENADSSDMSVPPAPPRRTWLRAGFVSLLLVCTAATLTLAGSEMALVAALRQSGQEDSISIVIGLWCAYSVVGGFVYGALPPAGGLRCGSVAP